MTCDLCDEKASVFLTQIVDGQMQKVNLCDQCAKAKGVTDPTGFALADLLFGLGNEEKGGVEASLVDGEVGEIEEKPVLKGEPATCQACGFTQAQFKKAGRLGCAQCYKIFGDGLESLLKAMHKGTQHVGKVPAKHRALLEHHYELDDLKAKLDDAVRREAFEDAATLRDKILSIEAELETLEAEQEGAKPPVNVRR